MKSLSESDGGHGLGFATSKSATKGLTITEEFCAAALINRSDCNVVWHTRRRSAGGVSDDLCHPFSTGLGHLVHNGTWKAGVVAAKLMKGDWSDTSAAALYINLYGWKEFTASRPEGVWLHLTKKGVAVHYQSGSLWVETETGALASAPCPDWGEWGKAELGTYQPGEPVSLADEDDEDDDLEYRPSTGFPIQAVQLRNDDDEEMRNWRPCQVGKGRSASLLDEGEVVRVQHLSTEKSPRGVPKFIP
jgi:hypothetical protein